MVVQVVALVLCGTLPFICDRMSSECLLAGHNVKSLLAQRFDGYYNRRKCLRGTKNTLAALNQLSMLASFLPLLFLIQ